MRKLRLRQVRWLLLGHILRKWWNFKMRTFVSKHLFIFPNCTMALVYARASASCLMVIIIILWNCGEEKDTLIVVRIINAKEIGEKLWRLHRGGNPDTRPWRRGELSEAERWLAKRGRERERWKSSCGAILHIDPNSLTDWPLVLPPLGQPEERNTEWHNMEMGRWLCYVFLKGTGKDVHVDDVYQNYWKFSFK